MNKRAFVKNTAVMTMTSLLLRSLGIVFRIFISNRVGAEGMGLYQLVFSVYVLGGTFASAGLVTAVTRLVAEQLIRGNRRAARWVMRASMALCIAIGLASAVLLYAAAEPIGRLVGDMRTVPAIRVSGLALPFIGVTSCIRGYFAARRRAGPPCLAQIIEQLTRIGSILWMLRLAGAACSLADACRIIILGDALSEAVSCCLLAVIYRQDSRRLFRLPQKPEYAPARRPLLRALFSIAVPITAGRYLSTILRTAENILVPMRLTLFTGSDSVSLEQFGAVKGMALPLIFFPSALLLTISSLLVPELSDAHALGQRREVTRLVGATMHSTMLGSVLIGCLFTVFGRALGELLYKDATVGLLLQILGPLTPVMYLDSIATGMLKGLGEQVRSLWYSVADSIVRIVLILLLLPRYGLVGFLFVMLVSNLLTSLLSTHRLLAVSGTAMRWYRWVIGPTFAAALVGGGWYAVSVRFRLDTGLPTLLLGALCVCGAYGLLLPALGCLRQEDVAVFKRRKQKNGCRT